MAQKIANPLDGNLHRKTLIVPTEFPEWFKLARPDSILDRGEVAALFGVHSYFVRVGAARRLSETWLSRTQKRLAQDYNRV